MSADQEAFEAWYYPGVSEWECWQAAIAYIKQNYTICEKEPGFSDWRGDFWYRVAKS